MSVKIHQKWGQDLRLPASAGTEGKPSDPTSQRPPGRHAGRPLQQGLSSRGTFATTRSPTWYAEIATAPPAPRNDKEEKTRVPNHSYFITLTYSPPRDIISPDKLNSP